MSRPIPAELAWLHDAPRRISGGWTCRDCGRGSAFAPSVVDPDRCGHCARARYRWRTTPGPVRTIRIVPPVEAARWEEVMPDVHVRPGRRPARL